MGAREPARPVGCSAGRVECVAHGGTGIVLDTSNSAVLFDREQLQVLVGYDADGFSSNALTFLAELRAGVDVVTPLGVRLVGSGSP